MIAKFISRLKEYQVISLIVAACYFAGYFSFSYHYRLLGLSNASASPLDYLTYGGDFFLSSIIKIIKVPLDFPISFFSDLFFGEFKFVSWLLIITIAVCLIQKRLKGQIEKISLVLFYIFIFTSQILLISWQSKNLHLDNVLTVPPARLYLEFTNKEDMAPCDILDESYERHLGFMRKSSPSSYERFDKWFNMKSTEDLSENRLISYSGICILLLLSILLWITQKKKFPVKIIFTQCILFLLFINLILLPITYGILGRNYSMQYSTIKFKTPENILQNRVYIIREESDQYIVYDKLNFFQIKYIKKTDVKEVDQLFILSPFQSPIYKQHALCDSLLLIPIEIDY